MKIGLDFDGVISDCGKLKSDGARILYGVEIPAGKFKTEIVVGQGFLSIGQYRNLQKQIYETEELGLLMEIVEGALEYLPRLQNEHELKVITSRNNMGTGIAREFMNRHGLNIPLIGIGGGIPKSEACRGMDVYVDDDLDKLEPLVDIVPHRYLFSWGYNEHINEKGIAKRVKNWQDFYEKISSAR